jgi:hypothetical protein
VAQPFQAALPAFRRPFLFLLANHRQSSRFPRRDAARQLHQIGDAVLVEDSNAFPLSADFLTMN